MNSVNYLSRIGYSLISPNSCHQEDAKNSWFDSISSAFRFLQLSDQETCKQLIDRKTIVTTSSDSSYSKLELELVEICSKGIDEPNEENEKILIQQAQELIEKGVKISEVFKDEPLLLVWLRTHCVEALQERLAISKEGLEVIDFDTLLPPNWQPPDWFLPARKLEISDKKFTAPKSTNIGLLSIREFHLSVRDYFRPLAIYLEENDLLSLRAMSAFSALNIGISYWLQDWRIMLISGMVFSLPSSFLNEQDLKHFQQKALENPLYHSLWAQTIATSPVELKCVSISEFLREEMTADDVSTACYQKGKIKIANEGSNREAFEQLIFESANAFQEESYSLVCKKVHQGKLSKEEYARLTEYEEWHTLDLYHQIMNFGKEHLKWSKNKFVEAHKSTFKKNWELGNARYPLDKTNSHADQYRYQWDLRAFLYFLRNPEKAPLEEDWLNKIRNFHQTPLQALISHPEFAMDWKKDPFIQLIEKGSAVNSDLITRICDYMVRSQETSTPEYTAMQVARIKELQKHGVSIPTNLSAESKTWLEKNL